jgi:CO/xanthine dehydrogenase Mo-binding subunit
MRSACGWQHQPEEGLRPRPVRRVGIGEIGITGAAAAVANAYWRATGLRIRDLPITRTSTSGRAARLTR